MSRIRTFLAVPLPHEIRDHLKGLQHQLEPAAGKVRWVELENLHVTMIFLGDVSSEEVPGVCQATQEACAMVPSFGLSVQGVGCFPNPQRPRILWAGVQEGTEPLRELYDLISINLERLGFRREERQYTPHVTIGRFKQGSRGLADVLQSRQLFDAGSTLVEEVHIYSSELTSKGSRYTIMGRGKLSSERD